MFCTKCGLRNDDDSLFCAGCGAPLKKPQYTQNMSYDNNTSNVGVAANTNNADKATDEGKVSDESNASDENTVSNENQVTSEGNVAGESNASDTGDISNEGNAANESSSYSEDTGAQPNDISSALFTQVSEDISENKANGIVEESIKSISEEVNQIEKEEKPVQPQSVAQQPFFAAGQPQAVTQQQFSYANQSQPAMQTEQPFGSVQPQMNGANRDFAQPSGYNNTQQYGGQQNMNAQNSNFGQQFSAFPNDMPSDYGAGVQKNKFSFKRFFFSMIVILASIAACAGIAFNYVGIKISASYGSDKLVDKTSSKGYEIIKEKVEDNDLYEETYEVYDGADEDIATEFTDSAKLFRIVVIVFECAMIAFVIIDFILLVAVRRKGAYIFTLLFSLIKMGLGGYVIYLWCFDILDKYKKVLGYMSVVEADIRLTATPEIGLILAVGLQILIFICSIVLLTCKNRDKLA